MDKQNPVFVRIILFLLFLILLIHSLIAARDFLYPLALANLFAYMLYPFVTGVPGTEAGIRSEHHHAGVQ